MKKMTALTIILSLAFSLGAFAQSVIGKWKTVDDKTGEDKSIVEIFEVNGKIYGKVVEILNPANKNNKCKDCKGADKDKPILGITVIKGLSKEGDKWTNGQILDPNEGKLYKCTITLKNANTLDVRGYIGISLIGRSQTWTRVK